MPLAHINGVNISYYTIGSGKPVLFISGLGMDNMCWIYQVPTFHEQFKVIVFDNRGIGKSSGTIGPYTIRMRADDAVGLLNHLNVQQADVIGTSMGGMIAQEIAIKYPDKVNKLVLSSTFAHPDNKVAERITEGIKNLLGRNVEEIIEIDSYRVLFDRFFNYFLRQIFTESFIRENRRLIETTLRKYLSTRTYIEAFLKQISAIRRHNVVDKLDNIPSETLIVAGEEDKLVLPECSDLLAEKIPHSHLEKIPQGEHGLHFEMPTIFNDMLLDFLSK